MKVWILLLRSGVNGDEKLDGLYESEERAEKDGKHLKDVHGWCYRVASRYVIAD